MVNESQPNRCESCGGGEFLLLASAKYQCRYCRAEQLPREIVVRQGSGTAGSIGVGAFAKIAGIVAIVLCLGATWLFVFSTGPVGSVAANNVASDEHLSRLMNARAELDAQAERERVIIGRGKAYLDAQAIQWANSGQAVLADDIIRALDKRALDNQGKRLQDELMGALNRRTIANRRYRQSWFAYQGSTNPLSKEALQERGLYPPEDDRLLR